MKTLKNSLKLFYIIIPILALIILSCENDDANDIINQNPEEVPNTFSEYFGTSISRDFIGTVVDINENPIEGVQITIGSQVAMTDSNGVFILNNASVNERFGYIKAEKSGYIHGSRSIVPTNGKNKVNLMLLEATVVGTVNSGSPETVTMTNGSAVSFDGNFINSDGTPYTGSVDVIMHYLDPTNENTINQMPGMLYAENESGAERMLQTLGMLAVELRGTSGEDLNLAEGSASEIKIPVDASLLSSAPATIPLWYFDEANGYWKEEGQATLQGNMYVGTVSHFSFWNCDIPAEASVLCINVTDNDNEPISNLWLSITSATYGTTYGYTNEAGEVCGYAPNNEALVLNVYIYDFCSTDPILTQTIGPFTTDEVLSITVTPSTSTISETVTGIFNTCSGDAVTDGYVQLGYGNQIFTDAVSDGMFEINLIRCPGNDNFSISGSDYVNLQTTDSINYTFTTPITNIGTLSACNAVNEFIEYTIDNGDSVLIFENIQANFYDTSPQFPSPSLYISGSSNAQGNCYYMEGRLNSPDFVGTYDTLDFQDANDTGFWIAECLNMSNVNNNIVYNLTTLGDIGEYIDINFSGDYEDYDGIAHTITGVVHVLRD